MGKSAYYQYYVEGADDKKIVDTLKTDMRLIVPGKCDLFNAVEKRFTCNHIMNLKENTTVILVFDVDTGNIKILKENIEFLTKQRRIKRVICIPQVSNLEEELVRCCTIKQIRELTKSKSNSDFKRDVLSVNGLEGRMKECGFNFSKFWASLPSNEFQEFGNQAKTIKIS